MRLDFLSWPKWRPTPWTRRSPGPKSPLQEIRDEYWRQLAKWGDKQPFRLIVSPDFMGKLTFEMEKRLFIGEVAMSAPKQFFGMDIEVVGDTGFDSALNTFGFVIARVIVPRTTLPKEFL